MFPRMNANPPPPQACRRAVHGLATGVSISLGVLLILLGLAGMVATGVMPRKYCGTVLLEMQRPPTGAGEDALRACSSPVVLGPVVAKLDLVHRWNVPDAQEASRRLAEMLEVRPEHGTNLVRLEVFSPDAPECAELANALAAQYIDVLKEAERAKVLAEFEDKADALSAQAGKLKAARARKAALAEKLLIFPPGTAEETREVEWDGVMCRFVRTTASLEQEEATLRSQVAALAEKEGDALVAAAAEVGLIDAKDPVCGLHVSRLMELHRAEGEDRGAEHPAARARLRAELVADREAVDARVKRLRSELETRWRSTERRLENLRRVQAELTAESAADQASYEQANDGYLREMRSLEDMIDAQVKAVVPLSAQPWIVEEATVPTTHATPNGGASVGGLSCGDGRGRRAALARAAPRSEAPVRRTPRAMSCVTGSCPRSRAGYAACTAEVVLSTVRSHLSHP